MGENEIPVHLLGHNLRSDERMVRACLDLTDARLEACSDDVEAGEI